MKFKRTSKQQLKSELEAANTRITDLEARLFVYEGVLAANGFSICIPEKNIDRPEMGFVGRQK